MPFVNSDNADWIWFHASSLGEFEQGRPVIEAIKQQFPHIKILLSFFSPSGYELRKDYPLADEVCYLPVDTLRNARTWIGRHHFIAAFFIKYDFWFNYIKVLHDNGIPLCYISVLMNRDQYFFKWYGSWFRKQLRNVSFFYAQDANTSGLLQSVGIRNVKVCGDTRFDRVAAIAKQARPFPEIVSFINGRKCIIAGSSWQPDERLLAAFMPQMPSDYCLIVAPHDISPSHINQIKSMFPDSRLYSELAGNYDSKVLIVNTIGILSQLYQYARFAYVGGGFGVNIHNIQEAVTFGCPVVFGPKYKSFKEAVDLVAEGGAFPVLNQDELNTTFSRLIADDAFYSKASATCAAYVDAQIGATEVILKDFEKAFGK